MNILLVEDNHADARLFAELLSELGGATFRLTTVDTLAAAIAALAGHDVVFLDLSLPDAHGVSTVQRMVQEARYMPIVVLTGNEDDRAATEAMKSGAQDFLKKSEISPSLIERSARYAIERKAAEENTRRLAKSDEDARRARFISSITAAITASFDLPDTLGQVAKLMVPTLGDFAVIDLVREGNRIERVAAASADPVLANVAGELVRYVPGTTHPKSPVLAAIETREQTVIEPFDAATLAPDSEYVATARTLQIGAMLVTPLVARDRVVGAITTMMGASRRTFEPDLRRLVEEVGERIALGIDNASLYGAAQRAIRGRDELLAVVSHDLRNPLNIITLALQMMEKDPDALAAALPRAKRGAERMHRLIEDLLDVARIDQGTLHVEMRGADLGSILDDTYEQHRVIAADKKITLVRGFDRSIGGVLADRHRLGQALANLVGNALKFTPAGGRITIAAHPRGEQVALEVTDTGPGIPPEHLSHIFDRFWQPQGRRDGVGLGLAIVKGIIDAHGGTLEVESTPGAGTTFRIVLARAEARATTEMAPLFAAR